MAVRDLVLTVAGAVAVEEEVVVVVVIVVIEIARLRLSHGRGGVISSSRKVDE